MPFLFCYSGKEDSDDTCDEDEVTGSDGSSDDDGNEEKDPAYGQVMTTMWEKDLPKSNRKILNTRTTKKDGLTKKDAGYGFSNSAKCNKLTAMATKAARGKTATIYHPVDFATNGMSNFLVSLGESVMWWFKPEYLLSLLQWGFENKHPNKRPPGYFKTLKHYGLRKDPHGANTYKRVPKGNSVINVITFVVSLPTSEKHKIQATVDEIMAFIYPCMMALVASGGGKYALDYLESTSRDNPDGTKGGIYGALTKNFKNDLKKVEQRLTSEMSQFFKVTPEFNQEVHLDYSFTDYDIREFVTTYHGGNSWADFPKNVRQACYKNKYKLKDLPMWETIEDMPKW